LELKDTIKKLANTFGVSGDEYGVSKIACELLAPYVDTVETDVFGNVIGYKSCGIKGAKTLMLDAHIDQIGFIITQVTDEGFLRFMAMGVDPRMLLGSELLIKTQKGKKILGIVAAIPPHLQKPGDNAKSVPVEEMVIDIGMTGEQAKKAVHVGDFACFAGEAFDLQGDVLCGKAMDDRACFACILHALELMHDKPLEVDLIIVGSTKEEQGGNGAQNVSFRTLPDYAIVIDVCHAKTGDSAHQVDTEMGNGPVITVGFNSRPNFAKKMMEVARARQIPYQVEADGASTETNAWVIQPVREGICTLVVSLPLKYMHSPVEMLKMEDVMNVGRLLAEFVLQFDGGL
jgi:endoglucanase